MFPGYEKEVEAQLAEFEKVSPEAQAEWDRGLQAVADDLAEKLPEFLDDEKSRAAKTASQMHRVIG